MAKKCMTIRETRRKYPTSGCAIAAKSVVARVAISVALDCAVFASVSWRWKAKSPVS